MSDNVGPREALSFAATAHKEHVYRGFGRPDEPYICHPVRVAWAVRKSDVVVALLHDCLEDAGILPGNLTAMDRAALLHLTRAKRSGESYDAYIGRLVDAPGAAGRRARRVKIADIRDNLSGTPPESLRRRYLEALARLQPCRGDAE